MCKNVYYLSNAVNDDIPDLHPAFEWQHLKQGQHGIAHVVKVKITRVGPEEEHNGNINLWQRFKKKIINQRKQEKTSGGTRLLAPRIQV